ncbi:NADH:flavin oxidoreductase [Striga asiatica]|uniref:NADH:flavin oxidoreductase n=1 Tax=Striga asiatica TaxID=4170 RepID=A0A5A7QDF5_STRAF|nr:NADH:flavin oxidoreductase [Striga asiatica]
MEPVDSPHNLALVESSSSIAEREDHIDSNSVRATPTSVFTNQPEREWNLELIPEGEETKMEIQEHNEKEVRPKGTRIRSRKAKCGKEHQPRSRPISDLGRGASQGRSSDLACNRPSRCVDSSRIEARVPARDSMKADRARPEQKPRRRGPLIADLVAYGWLFIANPDLVERLKLVLEIRTKIRE